MFIGHFAAGFGAKALAPRLSLGSLFLATQFLDLLWPTLLLLGVEEVAIVPGITKMAPLDFTHYPYSHSLVMALVWGGLFAFLYWVLRRQPAAAWVLGAGVVSHWVLDVLMHRPDLPLYPGNSPLLGLGLWNSMLGSVLVEGVLFVAGVAFYLRATRAKNKTGIISLWALLIFLVGIQVGNLTGPPPPSVAAIAWAGQLQWLFVLWGYWIDHHREPTPSATRSKMATPLAAG